MILKRTCRFSLKINPVLLKSFLRISALTSYIASTIKGHFNCTSFMRIFFSIFAMLIYNTLSSLGIVFYCLSYSWSFRMPIF